MYSKTILAPAKKLILLALSFTFIISCSKEDKHTLFQFVPPEETGITFSNYIETSDSLNTQTDFFLYNGAGVAVGDINNNGLPDIFFAGNMVSSRLYLNKGNMQFEDITEIAGIVTERRATGVSMVDINNNGFLDIYVSVSGAPWSAPEDRANLLFINNGDNTFTETAAQYGIDDSGFTTHAVFFDYNGSGYLDLFLLTNAPAEFGRGDTGRGPAGIQGKDSASYDQLYRNNGDGTFTNVSEEAGILKKLGYGLGVVATDLNGNGWPDLYVSNDITPNDVLYINNGDGTFTDKAADYLRHTSFAGMGIDIADFTNNGWPDIMQTDMMPQELSGRKRISGSTTHSGFMDLRRSGFFPHYNVNTLQMNHGITDEGDILFSEIARMAGVAYTDWSWTALFGDYDNNGFKDLFVTNGYPKAVNDFDYQSEMFNARQIRNQEEREQRELEILENLHGYEVPNYLFRNNGDLTFTDKSAQWGMNHPGFSYGAAHADLNNNGRLDLVVSNIDDVAWIYENRGSGETNGNWLQIRLNGEYPNRRGLGAKLYLTAGGQTQYIYHTPYRGYMSTMDDRVHFGLGQGQSESIDSLQVIWPDGRYQLLSSIEPNQLLTLNQEDALQRDKPEREQDPGRMVFEQLPPDQSPVYRHRADGQVDYSVQPLLPYMVSRQGPPMAAADVTDNGLDDVYIGGGAGQPGRLFLQQSDGSFIERGEDSPWQQDREFYDWGALFFDANGNGLPDLYVASGGYHLTPSSALLQDRLYLNQGDGRFVKDSEALPAMLTSTMAVAAGDFTGDGRPDLFVGGRLTPRNYPHPARSYLLRNDGGSFTDITAEAAPELAEPFGMITDAAWIDFNGNGRTDLVTVGEWMPVQFFAGDEGRLTNVTAQTGLPPMRGWWFSLAAGDFTGNGHMDLAAGNLGLNYTYTTSEESPFGVYAIEAGGIQSSDIILSQEMNGVDYPFDGLARVGRVNYEVAMRFPSFEAYSTAPVSQLYSSTALNEALHYQTDTFESVVLKNNGDGSFSYQKLPNMAQLSPVKSILAHDVKGNGHTDMILAGNLYHTEPNNARADAGNGLWLRGDGQGDFTPVPPLESGLVAPMDVRALVLIRTPNGKSLLVGNNNDMLQIFSISE